MNDDVNTVEDDENSNYPFLLDSSNGINHVYNFLIRNYEKIRNGNLIEANKNYLYLDLFNSNAVDDYDYFVKIFSIIEE